MLHLHDKRVKVDRATLVSKLKENLKVHEEEYAQAVDDYRTVLIQKFSEAKDTAKKCSKYSLLNIVSEISKLQPPADHRKDYADVIELLEYSVDTTIDLDQQSFKAYIKNEWTWTEQFKNTTSWYSTSAAKYK